MADDLKKSGNGFFYDDLESAKEKKFKKFGGFDEKYTLKNPEVTTRIILQLNY
jgi:hypothetical protein